MPTCFIQEGISCSARFLFSEISLSSWMQADDLVFILVTNRRGVFYQKWLTKDWDSYRTCWYDMV